MNFEKKYFQPFEFSKSDINRYLDNAKRDLNIAINDDYTEVRFTYEYQALIKACIALIAATGKVRVRRTPGHHIKIIEKASEILKNENIATIGNFMRKKRNLDLYSGGEFISEKEANSYTKKLRKL